MSSSKTAVGANKTCMQRTILLGLFRQVGLLLWSTSWSSLCSCLLVCTGWDDRTLANRVYLTKHHDDNTFCTQEPSKDGVRTQVHCARKCFATQAAMWRTMDTIDLDNYESGMKAFGFSHYCFLSFTYWFITLIKRLPMTKKNRTTMMVAQVS